MKKGQKLKREETKLVAVRLPTAILQRVEALSRAQRTGKSSVLIRCVEGHLSHLEQAEEWCAVQKSNLRPPPCQGNAALNTVENFPIIQGNDSVNAGKVVQIPRPLPLHKGLAAAA